MVLLAGQMIADAAALQLLAPALAPGTGLSDVDPRDPAVGNGFVTPWMERRNAPDVAEFESP